MPVFIRPLCFGKSGFVPRHLNFSSVRPRPAPCLTWSRPGLSVCQYWSHDPYSGTLTLHSLFTSLIIKAAQKHYSTLVLTTVEYMHPIFLHFDRVNTTDPKHTQRIMPHPLNNLLDNKFARLNYSSLALATIEYIHPKNIPIKNNAAQVYYSSLASATIEHVQLAHYQCDNAYNDTQIQHSSLALATIECIHPRNIPNTNNVAQVYYSSLAPATVEHVQLAHYHCDVAYNDNKTCHSSLALATVEYIHPRNIPITYNAAHVYYSSLAPATIEYVQLAHYPCDAAYNENKNILITNDDAQVYYSSLAPATIEHVQLAHYQCDIAYNVTTTYHPSLALATVEYIHPRNTLITNNDAQAYYSSLAPATIEYVQLAHCHCDAAYSDNTNIPITNNAAQIYYSSLAPATIEYVQLTHSSLALATVEYTHPRNIPMKRKVAQDYHSTPAPENFEPLQLDIYRSPRTAPTCIHVYVDKKMAKGTPIEEIAHRKRKYPQNIKDTPKCNSPPALETVEYIHQRNIPIRNNAAQMYYFSPAPATIESVQLAHYQCDDVYRSPLTVITYTHEYVDKKMAKGKNRKNKKSAAGTTGQHTAARVTRKVTELLRAKITSGKVEHHGTYVQNIMNNKKWKDYLHKVHLRLAAENERDTTEQSYDPTAGRSHSGRFSS